MTKLIDPRTAALKALQELEAGGAHRAQVFALIAIWGELRQLNHDNYYRAATKQQTP